MDLTLKPVINTRYEYQTQELTLKLTCNGFDTRTHL